MRFAPAEVVIYDHRMNIVFDFGNVLFEWDPVRLIEAHYPQRESLPHTPSSLAEALISHQDWLDFDRGLIDPTALADRSAVRLGLDAVQLGRFIARIPHVLPICEDAISVLRALAEGQHGEHRLLYLSNMPTAYAEVLEARCPWIAQFDAGIFSGRVNMTKPNSDIYAEAERRFNLDPAETLFLDDSPPNVHAARARGWRAEIINRECSVAEALGWHGVLRAG